MLALVVGLCFGVTTSVSTVQAADMSIKMASMSGMMSTGEGLCSECAGHGDDMAAMDCSAAACSVSTAGLATPPAAGICGERLDAVPCVPPALNGRIQVPDPHPPRSNASL
jgi:hypothetical protein